MQNVYDLVLGKDGEMPNRDELLDEISNRSMFAISPLSIVTHLPLIQKSVEDTLFEKVSENLSGWFSKPILEICKEDGTDPAELVRRLNRSDQPPKPLLTVHDFPMQRVNVKGRCEEAQREVDDLVEEQWKQVDENQRVEVWRQLPGAATVVQTVLEELMTARPGLFLVGAYSHIGQMVHSRAFEATPPAAAGTGTAVLLPAALQVAIRILLSMLDQNSRLMQVYVNLRVRSIGRTLEREHKPRLGGAITQFGNIEDRGEVRNLRLLSAGEALAGDPQQLHGERSTRSVRLRWQRWNQYWSYSFIESFQIWERSPSELASVTQLAKTPEPVRRNYMGQAIQDFIAALCTMALPGNVLSSSGLRTRHPGDNLDLPFPGGLVVGAHYAFVPLGVMIAMLFYPGRCARLACLRARDVRQTERLTRKQWTRWERVIRWNASRQARALENHSRYAEFVGFLQRGPGNLKVIGQALADRLRDPAGNQDISDDTLHRLMQLGGGVSDLIARSNPAAAAEIGGILAEMCADFWRFVETWDATNYDRANSREADIRKPGYYDFVACFVIDKSALYFTNFMPLGEEKFTRTFFVDLCLGSFQRGRLALRLSDIAAFRALCVKEVDRVRDILKGIDQTARHLNELQGTKGFPGALSASGELARDQHMLLDELDRIQEEMAQYDLFLTYGVRGRCLSTRDYLEMIKERVEDIRQDRIVGYPMLGDFLNRRVAHIVRDFERTSSRYDELGGRVQDLYGRIRTRLDSTRARRQLDIQIAADLVVYVGASYYGYELFRKIVMEGHGHWIVRGLAVAALFAVVLALRLLLLRIHGRVQGRYRFVWAGYFLAALLGTYAFAQHSYEWLKGNYVWIKTRVTDPFGLPGFPDVSETDAQRTIAIGVTALGVAVGITFFGTVLPALWDRLRGRRPNRPPTEATASGAAG